MYLNTLSLRVASIAPVSASSTIAMRRSRLALLRASLTDTCSPMSSPILRRAGIPVAAKSPRLSIGLALTINDPDSELSAICSPPGEPIDTRCRGDKDSGGRRARRRRNRIDCRA
jgi:hypothetical protein